MPTELAADACGVAKSTVLSWVQRGEAPANTPAPAVYGRFAQRYRRAVALFAHACVAALHRALVTDDDSDEARNAARAAMWTLARRWPEHWGRRRESNAFLQAELVGAHVGVATEERAVEAVVKHFGARNVPAPAPDPP